MSLPVPPPPPPRRVAPPVRARTALPPRPLVPRCSLYLYSADDPLCLADKLDELIAARRAAGADVEAVRWEASQHVGHLMRHPRRYRQALLGFLAGLAD